MSVQALSCAMAIRGVTSSEKLMLLVLANFADEVMSCWPSHKRLADDTGLTQRTVLTVLKALEGKKLISRAERSRSDGSRTSDKITLHLGGEMASPRAETISVGGETVSGGGETSDTGVGKSTAGGGEIISPLTTFEPSTEPKEEPKRATARDLAQKIWDLQPVLDGKRRSTRPDVERALAAVLKVAQPDEILGGCRAYYALPASRKDAGAFAMGAERLLQRDRWREFLPNTVVSLPVSTFSGPAEIRAAVVAAQGEDFARAWLDRCTWDDEGRAVVSSNGFVVDRLRRDVGPVLSRLDARVRKAA